MARLIRPDGTERDVAPSTGTAFTLDELQEFVDGWIELIRLDDEHWLVINEEGKLRGLPHNIIATDLARRVLAPDDVIVGAAVLASSQEVE